MLLGIILILFISGNPPFILLGNDIVFAYKTKYSILEYDSSIKYLKNTHELSFNHSGEDFNLDFLRNMKKIQKLRLNVNPKYTDFAPIALCENLNTFQSEFGMSDLSFLSNLIELRSVEINPYSYSVANIDFVRKLKKLEHLSIPLDGNADYSVLEELPCFKSIEIGGDCGDLTNLLNNSNIEYISLCTENADLSVAKTENNVKFLSCYSSEDMSYLRCFQKLKSLYLLQKSDGILDLTSLKSNICLEKFKLICNKDTDCSINLSDLKEISTLKNIELVNVNVLDEESISKFEEKGIIVKIEK